MTVGGEGKSVPATEGTIAKSVALSSANTPVEIISSSADTRFIGIKAHSNTGVIFIGWSASVDVNSGFPLEDGQSISFDLDVKEQPVYAVADTAGDTVRIIGLE